MKKLIIVFSLTALIMTLIFSFAGWYANNAALPRYCDNPGASISYVREILTSADPAGGQKRRPYIIAAKLIFLVPRDDGEATEAYLSRLREKIDETCGTVF